MVPRVRAWLDAPLIPDADPGKAGRAKATEGAQDGGYEEKCFGAFDEGGGGGDGDGGGAAGDGGGDG